MGQAPSQEGALLSFTRDGAASMSKLGERLMIHPTRVTSLVARRLVALIRKARVAAGELAAS